jgi:hypothetical protein
VPSDATTSGGLEAMVIGPAGEAGPFGIITTTAPLIDISGTDVQPIGSEPMAKAASLQHISPRLSDDSMNPKPGSSPSFSITVWPVVEFSQMRILQQCARKLGMRVVSVWARLRRRKSSRAAPSMKVGLGWEPGESPHP